MKLEARLQTSDILAEIDDTLFAVSNLSAKIAFENLFPTCEIGEEIADRYVESGSFWPLINQDEIQLRWNSIGRQCEALYCEFDCECHSLPEKIAIPGLAQPFLLMDYDLTCLRYGGFELPKNDADAVNYCAQVFGENAKFEIGWESMPVTIQDLTEPIFEEDYDD